jgi:LPXTG-site transpeptidase (sortase) family protein
MNQILVTEKLYITPEIKKKKRMYKVRFFLSVFLICILCSYYIYAESDRNKSEEVSHQIAADYRNANKEKENDTTTAKFINDVMIVALDERQSENAQNDIVEDLPQETSMTEYVAKDGEDYTAEAFLTIPKLDISYPVLSKTSDELLKISLNKYWGNGPNKVGNYCIVGHNYANGKLFGKLSQMEIGDIAELKSISNGKTVQYEAYAKYTVNPDDVSCTSQLTDGKREITLITCKNFGTQRLIIKCREI